MTPPDLPWIDVTVHPLDGYELADVQTYCRKVGIDLNPTFFNTLVGRIAAHRLAELKGLPGVKKVEEQKDGEP
jgi:hypothetical protein